MVNFFYTILGKVASLIMAGAIFAVGLVSMPEMPRQSVQSEQPKQEIILGVNKGEEKVSQSKNNIIKPLKPAAIIEAVSKEDSYKKDAEDLERQTEELKKQIVADLEKKAEEEKNNQLAEQQRQEELKKQAELEQKLAQEAEARRKTEEETAQKEYEAQTTQKIETKITYFSSLISSVNQKIEQIASAYRTSMDREKIGYLNQTDSYTSIYKPSLTKRHREILNEASKGIWTDCGWLRDLWDYQDGDYQQYSTGLTNAERTLKSSVDFVASSYMPDLNLYLNSINKEQSIFIPTKATLNQYLNQLNSLSVSGIENFKNEVGNLISELNSLESKINDAKSYSFSYPLASSILSGIDPLIQEEKAWFAKTSCKNLP